MANGKKSIVLYTDLIYTVNKLTDVKAGKLFKHILRYVNDENPQTNDMIINIAFEPIKQQLKRDLQKWEGIREKRSLAGKASAKSKKQKPTKSTSVKSVEQKPTKSTVNVNVSVNDNVINNKQVIFLESLKEFQKEFSTKIVQEFYDYWSEPNQSKTKIRYELEKTWDSKRRLKTWIRNKQNFK